MIFLASSRAQLFSPQLQNAFEIETWWAILITAGALLLGALIGLLIGWYITGRDQKRAKSEVEQLRIARDTAQSARAQAMNERERAMRELQGKQQEYALVESQLRTTQKQLDQAQAALHVSDQQSEELTASARALRLQVDELRKRLAECEQVSSERHMALTQISSELNETQARFNETQRLAAERQATLVSVNAQLSEYRARIAEADISTAEMQATLLSLGSQIEAHRMRLAEIERRAQAPREALVPSSTKNVAIAKENTSAPKQRSISAPVMASPASATTAKNFGDTEAPTPEPVTTPAQENEDDQIVALQDQVASLMEQLQTLRTNGNGSSASTLAMADMTQTLLASESPELQDDAATPAPYEELILENIKGIGVGYAARLRAAGVTNVRDLANSTHAQLEAIIKAPKWRQPDYDDWVRTARLMVRSGAL